jgi:hypothetical protein
MLERDQLLPVFSRIGLCIGLKSFFFLRPMGLLDLVL